MGTLVLLALLMLLCIIMASPGEIPGLQRLPLASAPSALTCPDSPLPPRPPLPGHFSRGVLLVLGDQG